VTKAQRSDAEFDRLLTEGRAARHEPGRCPCGKRGYLEKLKVRFHARTRKATYLATWAHPDDDDSESLCEYEL
jgi:hypothetical protein